MWPGQNPGLLSFLLFFIYFFSSFLSLLLNLFLRNVSELEVESKSGSAIHIYFLVLGAAYL